MVSSTPRDINRSTAITVFVLCLPRNDTREHLSYVYCHAVSHLPMPIHCCRLVERRACLLALHFLLGVLLSSIIMQSFSLLLTLSARRVGGWSSPSNKRHYIHRCVWPFQCKLSIQVYIADVPRVSPSCNVLLALSLSGPHTCVWRRQHYKYARYMSTCVVFIDALVYNTLCIATFAL